MRIYHAIMLIAVVMTSTCTSIKYTVPTPLFKSTDAKPENLSYVVIAYSLDGQKFLSDEQLPPNVRGVNDKHYKLKNISERPIILNRFKSVDGTDVSTARNKQYLNSKYTNLTEYDVSAAHDAIAIDHGKHTITFSSDHLVGSGCVNGTEIDHGPPVMRTVTYTKNQFGGYDAFYHEKVIQSTPVTIKTLTCDKYWRYFTENDNNVMTTTFTYVFFARAHILHQVKQKQWQLLCEYLQTQHR